MKTKMMMTLLFMFAIATAAHAQLTSFHDYTGDDSDWGDFTPGWVPSLLHTGPAFGPAELGKYPWVIGYLASFAQCYAGSSVVPPNGGVGMGLRNFSNCGIAGGGIYAVGIGEGSTHADFQFYDIYGEVSHTNLLLGYLQDQTILASNCDLAGDGQSAGILTLYEEDDGC